MGYLQKLQSGLANHVLPVITVLTVIIVVLIVLLLGATRSVDCDDAAALPGLQFELDRGFQTSASYLYKVAKWRACAHPDDGRAQQIYLIVSDIKIKAFSYALINKITFWTSLAAILLLFLVPIINSFAKADSILRRILSPSQIPAVTLLAALSFAFYEDYKGKQSSTENLMRYAVFSTDAVPVIATNVTDALSVIDTGFRFSDQLPAGN